MRRPLLRLLVIAALLGVDASAASALDCGRTLAGAFAKFTRTRMKLMHHCRHLVLIGRVAGPCPDAPTAAAIAKARGKLRKVVNQACGGDDATCGTGGDDVDLATVGWNVAQCPNVHGGNCTNAIGHCGDVADCLICTGETAVDAAVALVYDDYDQGPALTEISRCQTSIAGSVARYFDATTSALTTCELQDLVDVGGTCPDPVKAAPRMTRASETLVNRICESCGSSDKHCGGDDLPPEWIGFAASCPDVTPPGATSCARPIHQLTDIVACVGCVTDYTVGCLDPLSVPSLKPYPAACP